MRGVLGRARGEGTDRKGGGEKGGKKGLAGVRRRGFMVGKKLEPVGGGYCVDRSRSKEYDFLLGNRRKTKDDRVVKKDIQLFINGKEIGEGKSFG